MKQEMLEPPDHGHTRCVPSGRGRAGGARARRGLSGGGRTLLSVLEVVACV